MNSLNTKKHKSYLQRLKFNPLLANSLVAKYLTNFRLVLLLLIAILGIGTVSYFNLPHRLNPELNIPIVIVNTALPGASPEDIESLLTVPLENKINSIKGIDSVNSTSNNSFSNIVIQFDSDIIPEKAKSDVQDAVDEVRDLPEDATTPQVFALDFEDRPIWSFVIKPTQGADLSSLMKTSTNLKKLLENLSVVDRVTATGLETRQIVISVRLETLKRYNLNPLVLADVLKKAIASYPAGNLQTIKNQYAFTIDPQVASIDDIRNIPVNVQGKLMPLATIFNVEEKPASEQNLSFLADSKHDPQRVVTLHVYKTSSSNIDKAGAEVKKEVQNFIKNTQGRFEIITVLNTADEISKQFTDLLKEFRSTILLVFASLLIFLGIRQALISLLTVPLTFLSAFIFMNIMGMSINFLSLFAFLLTLGLLVDDTIVVVSAMTRYFRTRKFSAHETGILVWKDTIVPIWSTTITTIWSFVPLLLSSGIIGEFIKPIPVVVTAVMISSTGIAVLITLPLMVVLLKPQIPPRVVLLIRGLIILSGIGLLFWLIPPGGFWAMAGFVYLVTVGIYFTVRPILWNGLGKLGKMIGLSDNHSDSWMGRMFGKGLLDIEKLADMYYHFMFKILNSKSARIKVILAIVVYSIVAFAMLPLGWVKNEFFPKTNEDRLYVNLELPTGTNFNENLKASEKVMEKLRETSGVDHIIAETGKNQISTRDVNSGANLTQFTLLLPPEEDRRTGSIAMAEDLRNVFKNWGEGNISVMEESGGPPAGSDIQIKLSGNDLSILDHKADQLVGYLDEQPGVVNATKSIHPGTSKLVFEPDPQKLNKAHVTRESIGLWMRIYASDFELDKVNFDKTDKQKQSVVFQLGDSSPTPENLGSLMIPTSTGKFVPLTSLGTLVAKSNPAVITRENYKRTVSVSAGARPGFSVSELNAEVGKYADSKLDLPDGYQWSTGGVNEENQKSVNSILQAMALAFGLILVTMVLQFNSFRQAAIVLMVIPLAVSSVFVAFGLTGTPLSFPALIGILSLFGIVVTNSMFLVDKINLNLREGMPFTQAVANAGSSRMEPILLTKMATILGLLPITLADPLWRGLGGAIISGLSIASIIMLFFIPVVYYSFYSAKGRTPTALKTQK